MNGPFMKSRLICFGALVLSFVSASAQVEGEPSPTPTPPPSTSIQIVNATSVPRIALAVNGRDDYPEFGQGLYTADAPVPTLKVKYRATDLNSGAVVETEEFQFLPGKNQSVVLLGDFSPTAPLGQITPIDPVAGSEKFPPSFVARVFSHDVEKGQEPVRVRVINGMPGKRLVFRVKETDHVLEPGEVKTFSGQPSVIQYLAKVGEEFVPVFLRQDDSIRNVMVIFFLQEGRPTFMRAFENVSR